MLKTKDKFFHPNVDGSLITCYHKRVMENKTQITESYVRQQLATNPKWVRRALIRLYERQTAAEQSTESTRNNNMRGFQPCDAKWFTRLAQFCIKYPNKQLSPKQLKLAWRPWRGEPAIAKYAGQLMQVISEDAARSAPAPQAPAVPAAKVTVASENACSVCGEDRDPICRCEYKAMYARQEAKMERAAAYSSLR